jgi:hypothetical protein
VKMTAIVFGLVWALTFALSAAMTGVTIWAIVKIVSHLT